MKDKSETHDRMHQPALPQSADKARQLEGTHQTRAVTDEQLRKLKAEGLRRDMVVGEVREIDEDNRTVELAFSSEAEVERWFGIEVLDHSPGAMRTERLADGGATLVNHDWDDHVGVVESVTIGADRRGRATVRFGRSVRASEVWQDVVDRIRRHVSVGYSIHKVEIEERSGMPDMVRVTDWEPHEISIVSVPADSSVGVGRSKEPLPAESSKGGPDTASNEDDSAAGATRSHQKDGEMKEKILRDKKGNLVRAKVNEQGEIIEVLEMIERAGDDQAQARDAGKQAEQKRVKAIMDMGRQYENTELAAQYVSEGKDPEDFQRALLKDLHDKRSKPIGDQSAASASRQAGNVGMDDQEVRSYSFMRALRALANPTDRRAQEAAAFEFEASRAAADQMGREVEGLVVPPDVLRRALNTSTTGTAAGDTGGTVVDTTLMTSSFIDLLRNRTVAMQLGTSMAGLVGNFDIPKQTAAASGYWIGEDEDAPEDMLELGQIGLRPKTVAALSEITRRMLMQSSMDVEALVRSDLATALALTIDKAFFYGTGSDSQPLGIANTSGINAVNFATAGKPTYAESVKMESEIAADNADVNSMAYVMASAMRGHFKTTEKFSGSNGQPIWEPGNTVNGYGTEVTNQIEGGDLVFGNFADALIGMWGGLELTTDPYTHSSKGRLRIVAMQDVDMVLRRVESFCLGRYVAPAP
ncbi:phage major capsid protein [Halomonas sp. MES3-P3E]|uniref:phage major capsid protein n=1 Tax=Halomonas sp. MES3-P3E TaxID=2058321 RepID=UPI000C32D419|nr:phage major capsid protein [Halomonas sp. MES3-P3E]PKG51251.1 phage major capsid protein [Halomonas sp. MES3-P3E]